MFNMFKMLKNNSQKFFLCTLLLVLVPLSVHGQTMDVVPIKAEMTYTSSETETRLELIKLLQQLIELLTLKLERLQDQAGQGDITVEVDDDEGDGEGQENQGEETSEPTKIPVTVSATTLGTNDTIGEFTITFPLSAVKNDYYITDDTSADAAAANTGVAFEVSGPGGFIIGSSSVSGTLTSTAKEESAGVFTIREDDSEAFTLIVTIDPNVAGQYRVSLLEVNYDDDPSGAASTVRYRPSPSETYRTGYLYIND